MICKYLFSLHHTSSQKMVDSRNSYIVVRGICHGTYHAHHMGLGTGTHDPAENNNDQCTFKREWISNTRYFKAVRETNLKYAFETTYNNCLITIPILSSYSKFTLFKNKHPWDRPKFNFNTLDTSISKKIVNRCVIRILHHLQ